jgi:hypothetical protein
MGLLLAEATRTFAVNVPPPLSLLPRVEPSASDFLSNVWGLCSLNDLAVDIPRQAFGNPSFHTLTNFQLLMLADGLVPVDPHVALYAINPTPLLSFFFPAQSIESGQNSLSLPINMAVGAAKRDTGRARKCHTKPDQQVGSDRSTRSSAIHPWDLNMTD